MINWAANAKMGDRNPYGDFVIGALARAVQRLEGHPAPNL